MVKKTKSTSKKIAQFANRMKFATATKKTSKGPFIWSIPKKYNRKSATNFFNYAMERSSMTPTQRKAFLIAESKRKARGWQQKALWDGIRERIAALKPPSPKFGLKYNAKKKVNTKKFNVVRALKNWNLK